MPSADTFDCKPIGELVRRYLRGVSIDPFARNKAWATYTNDLNPATEAQHHMDAVAFLKMLAAQGVEADTIIFDPPYSPRQITECYAAAGMKADMEATQSGRFKRLVRDAMRRVCKPGGRVLSFGWNSVGMGPGFVGEEMLVVCHGGDHNDTICLVERMTEKQEELYLAA